MYVVKGNTGDWEVVIGVEVHAQMTLNSKLFSGSSTTFGAGPNSQVSFVDAAMPGMLPVLNKDAIKKAVRTGLGLNAQINKFSQFDRKNYFYADLPQGYQITQLYHPIVSDGKITIKTEDGETKTIRIKEMHLEQDAGKSMHDQSPNHSFIDLNRAGVTLMEIVTEPDMSSPFEVVEYLKKLRTLLRYLETSDADMEKGNMRCDANVSVRKAGGELGTRCEIKNLNSIRNVARAIEYEAARQVELLENGQVVAQETRLFDANLSETRTMRGKEDAQDYRYFPDPDLLPIYITDEYIEAIKNELPELPEEKIARYISNYSLSPYDAAVLCAEREFAEFFEEIAHGFDAKIVANWIIGELFAKLNKANIDLLSSKINTDNFKTIFTLIKNGTISGKIAKQVFEIMFETGQTAQEIVEEHALVQVTDENLIENIITEVIANNADKVAEYKAGKDKLLAFFVGQVMKQTQGKANPEIVNKKLMQSLQK
jgi:aspartyl-tRNA(Asn)/glutamyl-tRNA(Gln) amidotransferase subunit B